MIANYKQIKLTEMSEKDTIYIRKTIIDFSVTFYCKFLKYDGRYVKGISIEPVIIGLHGKPKSYTIPQEEKIVARPTSCYLWDGKKEKYFNKQGEIEQ